ncbi:MarR family transcriptional regulator [Pluralibacter gergoviae]|nr:MarR family transcriptional regulator [Pluralibacter gergoviae]
MVAQSLLDPMTMATRAGLLREDMRLKTPVGVEHTALKASENTMKTRQGKRLRSRL